MAFSSVVVEGGMFPPDLLDLIATGHAGGQNASDFDLGGSQRVTDEIQAAFSETNLHWKSFQARLARSRESRTTLTRQDWIPKIIEILGFDSVNRHGDWAQQGVQPYRLYGRVGNAEDSPPFHVVGIEQSLDSRSANSRRSPHSAVQEYLNNSDALWGIVTNGSKIRLLRDSVRITRPTYIEFDLEGMIESNQYAEFVLLYRLLHRTRLPANGSPPEDCLLEKYFQQGIDDHSRVRERLRDGVLDALNTLGTGFITHDDSLELRERITSGELRTEEYYRQLLRLVYRLLFLMVAEERRFTYPVASASPELHEIYDRYYSVTRLRVRAEQWFADNREADLWEGLIQTFNLFKDDSTATILGLSALDGELFSPQACHDLESARCSNQDILRAMLNLSTFTAEDGIRRRVNYAGIDVEEFGSVYESLLDYHPRVEKGPQSSFNLIAGSERKETGSYYTPPELVHELIDSALAPVINQRLGDARTTEDKIQALLDLRVCDPAAGSGHFLLAAARRIAREVAKLRASEGEPTPAEYKTAIREVIANCIYAVDKNPLAVDLCKVALWIESHNSDLPLNFLNHHIKCGDSLVGVTDIDVLRQGIPDDAYKAIASDDRASANRLRRRNREEKKGIIQIPLGIGDSPSDIIKGAALEYEALVELNERTASDVHAKSDLYEDLRDIGTDWYALKLACDLWTAAFVMPIKDSETLGSDGVPTTGDIRRWIENQEIDEDLRNQVSSFAEEANFFHWPLEFPEVFNDNGGFDVIIGNPPWEVIRPEEMKFFGVYDPRIAEMSGQTRKTAITALSTTNPPLAERWERYRHSVMASSKFLRISGRFPLGSKGTINTYAVFTELTQAIVRPTGRSGIIVPTGIATDKNTSQLFGKLVDSGTLASLYDFENREGVFQGIHRSIKFCLLTTIGSSIPTQETDFAFFLHQTSQLRENGRRFSMSSEDFKLFNPNTRTCPIFRTQRDMRIAQKLYRRSGVLIDKTNSREGDPWGVKLSAMFHMTGASGLFRLRNQLESEGWMLEGNVFVRGKDRYLPLYEAKLFHQYDHRFGTFDHVSDNDIRNGNAHSLDAWEKSDPSAVVTPRYWVPEKEVLKKLDISEDTLILENREQRTENSPLYALGTGVQLVIRKITTSTNERTGIAAIVPQVGSGDSGIIMTLGS